MARIAGHSSEPRSERDESPSRPGGDENASRPGRARAAHLGPERRRPLVLDAAFELFLKNGYEGTSMEAVAVAAGVTKPVVYACFASKEELFAGLFRREEARVLGEIAATIPDPGRAREVGLEPTLAGGFAAFLRAVAKSPRAYRVILLGEGGVSAAAAERIRRGRERQVEALARFALPLLEGSGSADARKPTARLLGHLVAGLAESGARAMLEAPDRWTPESLGAALARLAGAGASTLRGALSPPPAPAR